MFQIISHLLQKILFILIINKIFARDKQVQKIGLMIREQKTSCSHDVKRPERNAALYATQRDVQIDLTPLKYQRHLAEIIHPSMDPYTPERDISYMGENIHRIFLSHRFQQIDPLYSRDPTVDDMLFIKKVDRFHTVPHRLHRIGPVQIVQDRW